MSNLPPQGGGILGNPDAEHRGILLINISIKESLMREITINIEGMSCQHCVMRVKRALEGLAGISGLSVEIGSAHLTFDEAKIQQADIENTVVKAGYKIK